MSPISLWRADFGGRGWRWFTSPAAQLTVVDQPVPANWCVSEYAQVSGNDYLAQMKSQEGSLPDFVTRYDGQEIGGCAANKAKEIETGYERGHALGVGVGGLLIACGVGFIGWGLRDLRSAKDGVDLAQPIKASWEDLAGPK